MRTVVWMIAGTLGVAALSALVAHAPERFRPILIMPALFGVLTGLGLARLSVELNLNPSPTRAVLAALLAVAGLANVARIAYDQLAVAARRNVQEDPQQLIGLQLLREDAATGGAAQKLLEQTRLRLSPTFEDYLMGRLLGVRWFPSPWPAVIWSGELLMAAALSGCLAHRQAKGSRLPPDGASPTGTSPDEVGIPQTHATRPQ